MYLGLYYLIANHILGLLSLFRCGKVYTISRSTETRSWVDWFAGRLRLWLVARSIPIQ